MGLIELVSATLVLSSRVRRRRSSGKERQEIYAHIQKHFAFPPPKVLVEGSHVFKGILKVPCMD